MSQSPKLVPANVLRFLARDPLGNFPILAALARGEGLVTAVVGLGDAVEAVAVASVRTTGLSLLDAPDAATLARLLAALPQRPRRLMLRQPWQRAAVEQALGATRRGPAVDLFAAQADSLVLPGSRAVRELTAADLERLPQAGHSWIADLLRERLRLGWPVHARFSGGILAAHVCRGDCTAQAQELCELYTAPAYRGRGLASEVVTAAARAVLASGRQPVYLCRAGNNASGQVARRCGFRHLARLETIEIQAP